MEVLLLLLGLYLIGGGAFLYSVWDDTLEETRNVKVTAVLCSIIWPIILVLYFMDE